MRFLFLIFLFPMVCFGDSIPVVPESVSHVLQLMEQRIPASLTESLSPSQISLKDGRILFGNPSESVQGYTYFEDSAPGIAKHIVFQQGGDNQYEFLMVLKFPKNFQHAIVKVHGEDALAFFNDTDVVVYTQENVGNEMHLNEWIGALKPNTSKGSAFNWEIYGGNWQWPITLDSNDHNEVSIMRNVPLNGVAYSKKARMDYFLQMTVHFQPKDMPRFFPFKETISTISAPQAFLKEGNRGIVNVAVRNTFIPNLHPIKPKYGLNLPAWHNQWMSEYTITIPAKNSDYPILIN